jgi:DNA processing protein
LSIQRDDARYWVAFQRAKYIGPVRMQRLLDRFGDLERAWHAPVANLRSILDDRAMEHVARVRAELDLDDEMRRIAAAGARVLTLVDDAYPRLLKEIPAPPPVLFIRGELVSGDDFAVAIVGTRRATPYGREVTAAMAGELGSLGCTIVSGLALGIDAVAHRAALEAGGRTIAVLGSGPDVIYPSEHRQLAARIIENGCLLSEYPPGRKPDAQNFPARNRLISGLSRGIVVVEAPERSGALITADFAADQGRDVFVVPGSVLAATSDGANRLLRDGARPVRNAADVLEDLGIDPQGRPVAVQRMLPAMDDNERRVLAALSTEPQHVDDVAVISGLPVSVVSAGLVMLELKGAARNAGALHYART